MMQVSSPSKFPEDCYIAYFSGKSIEDAIRLAELEAKRVGVEFISFYPQKAFNRSILVSY